MSEATPTPRRSRRQRRNAGETPTTTPRKLTREVIEQVAAIVRAGNYVDTAAAYAGIHRDTYYDWMKRGRRDIQQKRRSIHREFVETIEQALAQGEVRDLAIIGKAAEGIWQAAAWRLERRMPDKYGRRSRVEHTGDGGGPVQMRIDVAKLSDAELAQLEGLLEKGKPGDVGTGRSEDAGRGSRRDQS